MQASWGDSSICSPIPEPGVSVFTCELRVWLQGAQETRGDAGRRQVRALRPSLPSAARSLSPSSLVSGFQVLPPHGTAIGGDNGCVSRPQLQQKAAPAHSGALGEWRNSEQPSGTRVAGPAWARCLSLRLSVHASPSLPTKDTGRVMERAVLTPVRRRVPVVLGGTWRAPGKHSPPGAPLPRFHLPPGFPTLQKKRWLVH